MSREFGVPLTTEDFEGNLLSVNQIFCRSVEIHEFGVKFAKKRDSHPSSENLNL